MASKTTLETVATKWTLIFGKTTMVALQFDQNGNWYTNGQIQENEISAKYQFSMYKELS